MICKNCGAFVADNAGFCGNCGTTVTNDQSSGQGAYAQQSSQDYSNQGYQNGDYSNQGYQNQNVDYSNQGYQNQNVDYSNQGYQNQNIDYSNQGYQNPNGDYSNQQNGVYPLGTVPNYGGAPKKPLDKKKIIYIAIPVVALVLVVGIVMSVLSATVFGYKSAVKKYMNAFEDCDGAEMYDLTSNNFKELLDVAMDLYLSTSGSSYGSFSDYASGAVEVAYIEQLEESADYFMDDFTSVLGSSYKLSYKITRTEKADKKDLEKINRYIGVISKDLKFGDIMYVEVEVTGKTSDREYTDDLYFILTKEGMKWKVLAAGESPQYASIGAIDDIDDILSSLF